MKVYASDLLEITQVPTGYILEIADAHTTAGVNTASVEGLVIAGGDVDKYITGTGQEKSITNESIGRVPVAVLSTDGVLAAVANSGTTTGGGGFRDSSILQDTSGHVIIRNGASTAANLTVTGDLIVQGSSTTVESATLLVEDKYIEVNRAIDSSGVAEAPTEDGGVLVTRATAGEQPTGVASNTLGTHAGIRYNEGSDRWEVATAVPTGGGADGDWTAIPISEGGAASFTVTVAGAATIGVLTAATHGLTGTDFIISVYEIATDTYTQVIPEDVIVARTATTIEGATRAIGDILIKFPAETDARNFRVTVI